MHFRAEEEQTLLVGSKGIKVCEKNKHQGIDSKQEVGGLEKDKFKYKLWEKIEDDKIGSWASTPPSSPPPPLPVWGQESTDSFMLPSQPASGGRVRIGPPSRPFPTTAQTTCKDMLDKGFLFL